MVGRRDLGLDSDEAAIQGALIRLSPVLMTAMVAPLRVRRDGARHRRRGAQAARDRGHRRAVDLHSVDSSRAGGYLWLVRPAAPRGRVRSSAGRESGADAAGGPNWPRGTFVRVELGLDCEAVEAPFGAQSRSQRGSAWAWLPLARCRDRRCRGSGVPRGGRRRWPKATGMLVNPSESVVDFLGVPRK